MIDVPEKCCVQIQESMEALKIIPKLTSGFNGLYKAIPAQRHRGLAPGFARCCADSRKAAGMPAFPGIRLLQKRRSGAGRRVSSFYCPHQE